MVYISTIASPLGYVQHLCPGRPPSLDYGIFRCFLPHPLYVTSLSSLPTKHGHIHICMGAPLVPEKLEGPSTSLTFLRIELDTAHMEIKLPKDKLLRIQQLVLTWLPKRKQGRGKSYHL